MSYLNRIENSKALLALTVLGLMSAVAVLDVLTGYQTRVSSLYLVPVALASWTAGQKVGVYVSVICAGAVLGVDLGHIHKYSHAYIPFWNAAGTLIFFIVVASLVVNHRRLVEEQEANLRETMAKVKSLLGLVPVCAGCKKIRDVYGHWNEVEAYAAAHSGADLTHGLCPDCAAKMAGRADSPERSR